MYLPKTIAYIERLYHFKCKGCGQWWTVADSKIEEGAKPYCPKCGTQHLVVGLEVGEDKITEKNND